MDDFGPAKNLMTMCFTYYHIGKTWTWLTWRANLGTQNLSTSNLASREDSFLTKDKAVRLPEDSEG